MINLTEVDVFILKQIYILNSFRIFNVCECFAYMCIGTPCSNLVLRPKESLELMLKLVVNYHMDAENLIPVFSKSSMYS